MKTTYGIALRDRKFLMVYNPKRGGWEMPGGKVEAGETFAEAVIREFREESGLTFIPLASRALTDDCLLFAGKVEKYEGTGEMIWQEFSELPAELGFPQCEYEEQIRWARTVLP